jgi:undecaprenyl-phosphate 4-deoxy-4-formamido-L-arabinose transferase
MRPDLSLVIPVYRSPNTLGLLLDRVRAVLAPLGRSWEIIFVDDSGPDPRAWDVLEGLQADDPEHVVAIQLMRNFGQHNALMCGLHHAHGRFVVTMDDDLQNPPEEIPRLLEAIETQGLDLVYGTIADGKKHGKFRNLGSWAITKFGQMVFQSNVKGSSYRIMRLQLVKCILTYDLNFTFIDGLLAWNTQRVGQVTVKHHPRAVGRSTYSLSKLLVLTFNMITNFSLLPLQLISACGFLAAAAGLAVAFYYLVHYFFAQIAVPGYASTIIAILVLGGIQLLALGMMGEYIGRLHQNVSRKPQYVVRHVVASAALRAARPSGGDRDQELDLELMRDATLQQGR